MIIFNGQYPLKLLLWVWGALILFFLIGFTNWKAEIWLKYFPHKWKKNPHMWKCRPKAENPCNHHYFR